MDKIIDTEKVSNYTTTTYQDEQGDIKYVVEDTDTNWSAMMYENGGCVTFDTDSGIEDYDIGDPDMPDNELCAILFDKALMY